MPLRKPHTLLSSSIFQSFQPTLPAKRDLKDQSRRIALTCSLLGFWAASALALQEGPVDTYAACLSSLNQQVSDPQTMPCQTALSDTTLTSDQLAHVHAAIGMHQLTQNKMATAREALERALELAPLDPWVQANLGSLLLREENFGQALSAYNRALNTLIQAQEGNRQQMPIRTNIAAVYLNRSLVLRALGRYDEAHQDYARYREIAGFSKQSAGGT